MQFEYQVVFFTCTTTKCSQLRLKVFGYQVVGNKRLLGVNIYQEAFALFGSQDLPGNICLIWNQDVPGRKRFIRCKDLLGNICLIRVSRSTRQHSPYSRMKMYQASYAIFDVKTKPCRILPYSGVKMYQAFALFGCQDLPGIRLIRVSRCTRHSPYSGVKMYQAFALFGCQEYQAFALFGCQDVSGIRLIRVSRCTRHSPYTGVKMYQAIALFGCQDVPGIRLIQVSSFTRHTPFYGYHVIPFMKLKLITSSRAIQVSTYQQFNHSEKWGKIILVMSYLRCTLIYQLCTTNFNWVHVILHACNSRFNYIQAKSVFMKHRKLWASVHVIYEKTYI